MSKLQNINYIKKKIDIKGHIIYNCPCVKHLEQINGWRLKSRFMVANGWFWKRMNEDRLVKGIKVWGYKIKPVIMDAQTCDYRKNTQLCHCKMVFLLYVSYLFPSLKKMVGVLRRSLANIFHKSASYRHDIGFHVFILTLWLFCVLAYENWLSYWIYAKYLHQNI